MRGPYLFESLHLIEADAKSKSDEVLGKQVQGLDNAFPLFDLPRFGS